MQEMIMQETPQMPNELSTEQWAQLLSLLSLDGSLPLYEAMGVPVDDKQGFQKTLREAILDARRLYDASPGQIPSVAAMLFDRLGSIAAAGFAHWAQNAFLGYHADQPDWSAWDIVFSHWAYSRCKDLDFLRQQTQDSFIASYTQKAVTDDVKQRGEELLYSPLSEWDLEMFARRGYGVAWECSPYSTVEAIIRIERLKKFAGQVWQNLSLDERGEVQKRAQALIDELKVWMPGPLPSLEQLLGKV
jgi:hypothetical protein